MDDMDNLAVVVDSLTEANKALRKVIERGADEVGQLERFENRFRGTEEKFIEFKESVLKNDRQAAILESRLDQQVSQHTHSAEVLRRQIDQLKGAIADQQAENEKLERDLKDSVETLRKVNQNSDHTINTTTYINTTKSSQQPNIIQRLQNDPE